MRNTYTICILFLMLRLTSFAFDASERVFVWNEANALMQNAKTQQDYLRSAQVYQRLIDDGVRNGFLFYNIGTALLLADRNELAYDAFERAERYLGRRPDIENNLKIASARKAKSNHAQLPWYRLAAFWHFYFSGPQRTYIASFAFLAFWLALVLRKTGIKRTTNAIALASLVVFIIFATSVAASWQMEASAGRYNLQLPLPPTNAPAAGGIS